MPFLDQSENGIYVDEMFHCTFTLVINTTCTYGNRPVVVTQRLRMMVSVNR